MARRMILLVAALALLAGCGKKKTDPANPSEGSSPADAGASYTLKVREEQKGDKIEVTTTSTGTVELGGGKESLKLPEDATAEYTETVLEMPDGAPQPTKLTRAYKKATKYDLVSKGPKPLAYQGKTVSIEKKAGGYELSVDGKKLSPFDASELSQEFNRGDKKDGKVQDLLPKTAVKVGESWNVDPDAVRGLLSGLPFGIDAAKSKMTGKLVKAYTQDGKPWGSIAFDFALVIDPKPTAGPKGGSASGTIKITAALDAVIDGSAPDGTMKMTINADVTGKEPGKEMKMTADTTRTKTVKSVK